MLLLLLFLASIPLDDRSRTATDGEDDSARKVRSRLVGRPRRGVRVRDDLLWRRQRVVGAEAGGRVNTAEVGLAELVSLDDGGVVTRLSDAEPEVTCRPARDDVVLYESTPCAGGGAVVRAPDLRKGRSVLLEGEKREEWLTMPPMATPTLIIDEVEMMLLPWTTVSLNEPAYGAQSTMLQSRRKGQLLITCLFRDGRTHLIPPIS